MVFYWSQANLGLLVMAGVDTLLLIAFLVVAVTLGKPLSFLNCYVIGKSAADIDAKAAYSFAQSVAQNFNTIGANLPLGTWAGATRAYCLQSKTAWGFSIGLWYVFPDNCG